jgi:hypothetical protein
MIYQAICVLNPESLKENEVEQQKENKEKPE